MTHEIGHLVGLGHLDDDGVPDKGDETDATMYGFTGMGALNKQTLTLGDAVGAVAVRGESSANTRFKQPGAS